MKPTKNKFYCKDCRRTKMLFETEKKANTFIKFNRAEIQAESGYGPSRSYYCSACNGWHVTSKGGNANSILDAADMVELDQQKKASLAENDIYTDTVFIYWPFVHLLPTMQSATPGNL